jgi:4-hydroxy-tetrahydrodipicolinate reductase
MKRVIVNGAAGRMGRLIVKGVCEDPELRLVAALEADGHPLLGRDAAELAGLDEPVGVPLAADEMPEADVLVDFSAPAATLARAREAAAKGIALVIATTGLAPEQRAELESLSRDVAVLVSANMSLGVNLVFQLAAEAARMLDESFDIEIVEAHHRHKKDAPSGTALTLLRAVCEARGWNPDQVAVYGRHGHTGERPTHEVAVHAVRGGEVVGDHTVMFIGPAEQVSLRHHAQSREIFASGAVHVARFLAGRAPGLYTMKDALGL